MFRHVGFQVQLTQVLHRGIDVQPPSPGCLDDLVHANEAIEDQPDLPRKVQAKGGDVAVDAGRLLQAAEDAHGEHTVAETAFADVRHVLATVRGAELKTLMIDDRLGLSPGASICPQVRRMIANRASRAQNHSVDQTDMGSTDSDTAPASKSSSTTGNTVTGFQCDDCHLPAVVKTSQAPPLRQRKCRT